MKRIKSGDQVVIIAGKSKGHVGEVLKVHEDRVMVKGGNLIKKHVKANPQKPEKQSGIVECEASVHVSNVAHYNPSTKKAEKIGFKYLENNGVRKKVRYFKSNDELIDRA